MDFSPERVAVAWLATPGTIQRIDPDPWWECAGCRDAVAAEDAWLIKYRYRDREGTHRDLICIDCASRLTGAATRTTRGAT